MENNFPRGEGAIRAGVWWARFWPSCCGVTLTQCHLVGEVRRSGSQTLGQLAQTLELDPGSASRAVEAMVKQGYLERVPDPTDRRYVTISMTKAGDDLASIVEQTGVSMSDRVLKLIPPPNIHWSSRP